MNIFMCVHFCVCIYIYVSRLNNIAKTGVNNIPKAGVNNIPKAGVDVISKDALTRQRRGARFTTYVPKMLK